LKAIVDDLLIWGKDDDQHDAILKQVLNRASEVNLKFNAKTCRIRQEEVPYVGHVLSKEENPEKICFLCKKCSLLKTLKNLDHSLDLSSM